MTAGVGDRARLCNLIEAESPMKRVACESGFAFLAWFVPFAVSVCVFPLREAQRPLFEMIMSFTLTANTALLGLLYLRPVTQHLVSRGAGIGAAWVFANWLLDLAMFSSGPMQMPLRQYLSEIAGAYFVIPLITIALAMAIAVGARTKLVAEAG